MSLRHFATWAFLALTTVIFPAGQSLAAASEVARVIAVSPGAFVVRDGARVPLKLKDTLLKSDQVSTDASGKVQLLFADDTTVAVAPDSTVNITDFNFDGAEKASFAMSIGKGLARVVTGKVVQQNREGFKVTTPHATVGIRGTILTADVRTASKSVLILSQLGAGHTVSVINNDTGQRTEMPKAGLSVEAGGGGNVLRPATANELSMVQTVTRQTRQAPQATAAAQGGTTATAAPSPAVAAAAPATTNLTSNGEAALAAEDSSAGRGAAGKGSTSVNQVASAPAASAPGVQQEIKRGYEVAKGDLPAPVIPGGGSTGGVTGGGSTGGVTGGGSTGGVTGGGSTGGSTGGITGGGSTGGGPTGPDLGDGGIIDGGGGGIVDGGGSGGIGGGSGTDNPGALTASYSGELLFNNASQKHGAGNFSFDLNLGNGALNNGAFSATGLNGNAAAGTYTGSGGTGALSPRAESGGAFDLQFREVLGSRGDKADAYIDGALSTNKNDLTVNQWGVRTPGSSAAGGTSGSIMGSQGAGSGSGSKINR